MEYTMVFIQNVHKLTVISSLYLSIDLSYEQKALGHSGFHIS